MQRMQQLRNNKMTKTTNETTTTQQKELLICHESPTWESIAADLFVFHGKDYVVTTDRYSNFLRSGPTVLKVKFRSYYQDEGTHREIGQTQQAYVRQWSQVHKQGVQAIY